MDISLYLVLCLSLLYLSLLGVYRLFLSSLAHVPGPKLAALTGFWEMYYDLVREGQLPWKLRELHQHYGVLSFPRCTWKGTC